MKILDEVRCKICKRFFCCVKCRRKHEFAKHVVINQITDALETKFIDGYSTKKDEFIKSPKRKNTNIYSSNVVTAVTTDIKSFYVFCPMCEGKPLILQPDMYDDLLTHIINLHMPLQCQKCKKLYTKLDDLKFPSKCHNQKTQCSTNMQETVSWINCSCDTEESKLNIKKTPVAHSTISMQTSPIHISSVHLNNTENCTPISIINLRWMAKNKEQFMNESGGSATRNMSNISDISSIRRSIDSQILINAMKGKIIRSTSTPLQVDTIFSKPKHPTFNGTNVPHVSSIYNIGFESENNISLPVANIETSVAQTKENQNVIHKIGGLCKVSAVTPLRQVMSKSIKKALVEHGGFTSRSSCGAIYQHRYRFDLTNNNALPSNNANVIVDSLSVLPLDLRLSPVLRRTQTEGGYDSVIENKCDGPKTHKNISMELSQQKILLSAQKHTTESITIMRTNHIAKSTTTSFFTTHSTLQTEEKSSTSSTSCSNNTSNLVHKSCENVDIVASTAEMIKLNMQRMDNLETRQNCAQHFSLLTPITRIPGAVINKKLIKFETPLKAESKRIEPNGSCDSSEEETFFTPAAATPLSNLCSNERTVVARQLTEILSHPKPRPRLWECVQNKAFNRVEDITVPEIDYNVDDDFSPEMKKTKRDKQDKDQEKNDCRIWSIMSSVIRLPKFSEVEGKTYSSDVCMAKSKSKSFLKRCASFAGSLVRSKPIFDEKSENFNRKRTYTVANDTPSPPAKSSKRIRIQSRKPIDRMRLN